MKERGEKGAKRWVKSKTEETEKSNKNLAKKMNERKAAERGARENKELQKSIDDRCTMEGE